MTDQIAAFLEATVRTATPLALAALGESVSERTGVINVGLEGAIMAGCFGAVVGAAAGGVSLGLLGGLAAGVLVGLAMAALVVGLRTDQILTGTALTLAAYGATGTLSPLVFGAHGVALSIPTLAPIDAPRLAAIPLIGRAVFAQSAMTYLLVGLVPLTWWWLYRTHAGLSLRAVGEFPPAAAAAGVRVSRVRWLGILVGTALGGLAGATLVLTVGTFTEQMSAGRGFIAIAIVALGRWTPHGAAFAALLFGAASALQYRFQAAGSAIPYQAFLALPYVLTLVVLAVGGGRSRAPAALGRSDDLAS
ncbi:MAG: ABC transporter permease [Gemmatimonadaceae bacterium]|nr:ABC transporter permease [Gemmatimonadaceae bacterium]